MWCKHQHVQDIKLFHTKSKCNDQLYERPKVLNPTFNTPTLNFVADVPNNFLVLPSGREGIWPRFSSLNKFFLLWYSFYIFI